MNQIPGAPHEADDEHLRRLVDDAVSDVEPRGSLDAIRARTAAGPEHPRRPWLWGAGAAVVATAATVAAITVLTAGPRTTVAGPAGSPEPAGTPASHSAVGTTGTSSPSSSQSDVPSASASPIPAAGPTTVPVYYAGDTSRGPRLFREFHQVRPASQDQGAEIEAAVSEALAGNPVDGDYHSAWPAGTSASVGYDGFGGNGSWSVLLTNGGTDLSRRPAGMSDAEARLALQQLVYTVQGAAQDSTRSPVRFFVDRGGAGSNETSTVLGVPASRPVAAAPAIEALAQVWIIDPAQGADLTSPFTVSGLANAFEANVQWELEQGGQVVKRGFTTARECCTMAPYSFTVSAPPGQYTLVVHDSDASGGVGFAPWQDTKEITVR